VHIPDGYIDPATAVTMFAISIIFLVWSWKKVKADYPQSFAALLAIASAFVFAAQMINFPTLFGTSGHLVGGTFLALLLGPYAAMLSMTIVLLRCCSSSQMRPIASAQTYSTWQLRP
jgi:cobalt/nickel transport system permease protein